MDMNTAQLFFSGNIAMNDWIPFQYEKDGKTYFSSDAGDETFLVLEGELEIEVLANGEKFTYKPGDICSWTKGTPTMWDIKKPMKKVFVIADAKPE